jgi:hypothetical protein
MRIASSLLVTVKFLIATPLVLCGLVVSLMGQCFGPEGFVTVSLHFRLIGLGVLLGGLAVLYPFSLTRRRGFVDWLIVMLAALPAGIALGAGVIPMAVSSLLFPALALADLLLSGTLGTRSDAADRSDGDEQEDITDFGEEPRSLLGN